MLITSPRTIVYNCFSWAAGESKKEEWWDPFGEDGYWPNHIKKELTLQVLIEVYRDNRYEVCDNVSLEKKFEKIIIYSDSNGIPTHAARQLPDGRWTSKIGVWQDIEHELLEEFIININEKTINYGRIATVMKRLWT